MSSDAPSKRLLHTRQVVCSGSLRSDGLIEIEGRLLDVKQEDHDSKWKVIRAGQPIHQMRMVMVVDLNFVIHSVEAYTEASPTPYCPEATARYAALKGLRIGPGFKKRVAQLVGGDQGCTHHTELLGPMATTLYQSTFDLLRQAETERAAASGERPARPWVIGTCHAYRENGEAVQALWPEEGIEVIEAVHVPSNN